ELHRYRGARAVIVCAGCLRLGVAVVAAGNGIVVSADDVDPVRRLRTGKRGDDVDDLDGPRHASLRLLHEGIELDFQPAAAGLAARLELRLDPAARGADALRVGVGAR